MTKESQNDPMEFLKDMWGNMGFSLPGMVAPTVDGDELGKRIADLKAVEGWLKTNLGMLQMSIQALEVQRATLQQMSQISQMAQQAGGETAANPFLDPAAWTMPWSMMTGAAAPPAETKTPGAAAKPAASRKRKPPAGK